MIVNVTSVIFTTEGVYSILPLAAVRGLKTKKLKWSDESVDE